jgi:hypothetical protein
MEAETQFDLDDILCSNYTQTTGEEDDDGKKQKYIFVCITSFYLSNFGFSKKSTTCNVQAIRVSKFKFSKLTLCMLTKNSTNHKYLKGAC